MSSQGVLGPAPFCPCFPHHPTPGANDMVTPGVSDVFMVTPSVSDVVMVKPGVSYVAIG